MQPYTIQPALEPIPQARFALEGEIAERLRAVTANWILPAVQSNPAILEMFRTRDRKPYLIQWSWVGEYAGKYLTHAAQVYHLTGDERLRTHLDWFVSELLSLQAEDGYLGPWPKEWRFKKDPPNRRLPPAKPPRPTWDAWGHYHMMLGMLLWWQYAGEARALTCATRIADLLCRRFLDGPERMHDLAEHEMNLAPIHALTLLHHATGEPRYLQLAHEIAQDFEKPPAGDFIRTALAGLEFYQTPTPRWESLHPIQGIAGLYFATGDERYRQAFEHIWWSIAKGDRHNNGGFSSGEQAAGNPYDNGPIETCCTVAWMALSGDMLRLTGNPLVADELELSLYNSGLGLLSPTGRWSAYNTPMDGFKQGWFQDIPFHCQPGGPELSCCAVNGPRTLGSLSDWAVMQAEGGLALNYFGPGRIRVPLASGGEVTLTITGEYPRQNRVEVEVAVAQPEEFTLALRIPRWSEKTAVTVNRVALDGAPAGRYLGIHRQWQGSDRLSIEFDFRPHFWVNPAAWPEDAQYHPASIYRGPVLLAYDPRLDATNREGPAGLDAARLALVEVTADTWLPPAQLFEAQADDGQPLRLCDFASAGLGGQGYFSWLPVRGLAAAEFERENPLRLVRPG